MVKGDAEERRVVVEGDFFRASSDFSGRRYGSDGWCCVGLAASMVMLFFYCDGNACLLRKQKRRFWVFFSRR